MTLPEKNLFHTIKTLLHNVRNQVVRTVNSTMVETYYEIGKVIVEHTQKGQEKALYGKETLKELSTSLSNEFGKGFSVDNLENMRRLYSVFDILPAQKDEDS